jgi:hypothetical protein
MVIVLAGCSHEDSPPTTADPTAAVVSEQLAAPTPTETDVNDNGIPDLNSADKDWPGVMKVVMDEATSPEATRGREFMDRAQLLKRLADDINGTLKLPFDVTLKGQQCGAPNDYWSPGDKTLVMCFEDAAAAIESFTKLNYPDPQAAAFNTETAFFFHEIGHMVIGIYDLPATGREEDVADEASAYLMLRPNAEGKVDLESINAIRDTAKLYEEAANDNEVDDGALADVHSPDKARMYNFECWAYGADPSQSGDLVSSGLLPQGRADGCEDEYHQLQHAWGKLLEPYVK